MNERFREAIESLHPKYEILIGCEPHAQGKDLPKEGVYFFKEHGKPLYVGRSDNIPRRYKNHTRDSAQKSQAAFALLLVREELGWTPTYRRNSGLSNHPQFEETFREAKKRVRQMEFRAVEERDPTRQALLEIYCAVASGAPYNDFRTH